MLIEHKVHMDILTFLSICIIIIPLQIMLFLCLFWCRHKVDKYENLIVDMVNCKSPESELSAGITKVINSFVNTANVDNPGRPNPPNDTICKLRDYSINTLSQVFNRYVNM